MKKKLRQPSSQTTPKAPAIALPDYETIIKPKTKAKFSIISAVYNVSAYLDHYLSTIFNQTIDIDDCIEVILVDDGSTDDSADIIKKWRRKKPNIIRYLYQENAGQGAARNNGLRYAKNEWVTFIDPDDFISEQYFEEIDEAINKAEPKTPLKLVSANYIYYHEDLDQYSDTHPLRFRFANGDSFVPAAELGKNIILNVNCVLFKRARILEENLLFDGRIRPAFEDAHFVNRYLLSLSEGHVGFLKKPSYFYRKRADGSSTLDTGWKHPGRYDQQLELGTLSIIEESKRRHGHVKEFIQRTALYDISWHFKRLINHEEKIAFLDVTQRKKYISLIELIMQEISKEVLLSFELSGMWFYHKLGLLSFYKDAAPDFTIVYLEEMDQVKDLVKIKYFGNQGTSIEQIFLDNKPVVPEFSTRREHQLFGKLFTYETIHWIRLGDAEKLSITIAHLNTRISLLGRHHRDAVSVSDIKVSLLEKKVILANASKEVIALRHLSRTPDAISTYGNCWIFMDRDTQADDNAEHLYRHVRTHHPDILSFFIINSNAGDWKRLSREGFNLIAFGTTEHKLALLNASHLISSHADHYIFGGLDKKWYADLLKYKYTFLQHGVTKDDISSWLNSKNIDCLVTATKPEYDSIVRDGSYKFTSKEVVLTGFARHDQLLRLATSQTKTLLIMPTWRDSLVGPSTGIGNEREINPLFSSTRYHSAWQELLTSECLAELAKDEHYEIVFFPHANIQPYLDQFAIPDYVKILGHHSVDSMQPLLAQAAILVTDYSSIAFESAAIGRAVLYYQFDADEVFSGGHFYKPGYFNYSEHGFGPVANNLLDLIKCLKAITGNNGNALPEYLARMRETFAFDDQRACERIYDAIDSLDQSPLPFDKVRRSAIAYGERAEGVGQWQQAFAASHKALASDETCIKAKAAYILSGYHLSTQAIGEALQWLESAKAYGYNNIKIAKRQLQIAIEAGDFNFVNTQYGQDINSWIQPADAQLIALVSSAYRLQNQHELASEILAYGLADDRFIVAEQAELAIASSDWTSAYDLLTSLHALKLLAKREYVKLSMVSRMLGIPGEALRFIRLVTSDSFDESYYKEYAETAYVNARWKLAAHNWGKLDRYKFNCDTWLKVAKTNRKLGNHKLAEEALSLSHLAKDQRTYLQEKALLLSLSGNWADAVVAWKTFISRKDLKPNRDALLHLAEARITLGDYKQALKDIGKFEGFGELTAWSAQLRIKIPKADSLLGL